MVLLRDDDRGETLVEVLAAVVILGIAGVAVMAGLGLAVKSSDIHRKQTTGGAYVKSFAEAIENYVGAPGVANYKACAGTDFYTGKVSLSLPAGYIATQGAARSVGADGVAAAGCSVATDTGVQRVALDVKSADGRVDESLVIVLRNPCDPSVSICS